VISSFNRIITSSPDFIKDRCFNNIFASSIIHTYGGYYNHLNICIITIIYRATE
jgi:hypothetical protein